MTWNGLVTCRSRYSTLFSSLTSKQSMIVKNKDVFSFICYQWPWPTMVKVHMAGSSQPQIFFAAECVLADFAIAIIFSCDEQLKKWRCHSGCPFMFSCFRVSLFSFSVLGVCSAFGMPYIMSPREFQWCFKKVSREF